MSFLWRPYGKGVYNSPYDFNILSIKESLYTHKQIFYTRKSSKRIYKRVKRPRSGKRASFIPFLYKSSTQGPYVVGKRGVGLKAVPYDKI